MFKKKVIQNLALAAIFGQSGVEALYPDMEAKVNELVGAMNRLGKPVWVHSTFRNWKEQDLLHENGRKNTLTIVTNARGGESYHNYCLAADIIFQNYNWNPPSPSWWDDLGRQGEKLGLEWGGRWPKPDRPHFEYHPNTDWQELKAYIEIIRDIEKADSMTEKLRLEFKRFFGI